MDIRTATIHLSWIECAIDAARIIPLDMRRVVDDSKDLRWPCRQYSWPGLNNFYKSVHGTYDSPLIEGAQLRRNTYLKWLQHIANEYDRDVIDLMGSTPWRMLWSKRMLGWRVVNKFQFRALEDQLEDMYKLA